MKDPAEFSDAELQAEHAKLQKELNRREEERRKIAEKKRLDRQEQLRTLFVANPQVVDILFPDHERSSCDDNNRGNGDADRIRCRRCALLRYLESPYEYDGVTMNVYLDL